jgi:pimeloyl-ACP methyl ester carboxylesterase
MTNWMSGVCEANGINIHYLRTGGCKPPLVLLHGLTGSGACWIPLARALEGEYDVVMPDARGHGNSSTPLITQGMSPDSSRGSGLRLRFCSAGDLITVQN